MAKPSILLDEPLSNLDAKLRVTMRSEIVSHTVSYKRLLSITHDQTEAMIPERVLR